MRLQKTGTSGVASQCKMVAIALLVALICLSAGCGSDATSPGLTGVRTSFFEPASTVWLTGYPAPFVVASAGGGRTWNSAQIARPAIVLVRDVHFVTAEDGWAIGDGGVVLWSRDGGRTWASHKFVGNFDFVRVSALGPLRAWAMTSDGRVLRTMDGGSNWRLERMLGPNREGLVMVDITFVDAENGWAVGSELGTGIIMATHDGGRRWVVQRLVKSPRGESIQAVAFSDYLHGWCVGTTTSHAPGASGQSLVMRTIDGGIHWTPRATILDTSLTSVACQGSSTAYAVGTRGSTLRTTDGGLSWRRSTVPKLGTLTDVVFGSVSDGWCLGGVHDSPLLLTTRDGGLSWASVPLTGPASELRGILGLSAIRSRSH